MAYDLKKIYRSIADLGAMGDCEHHQPLSGMCSQCGRLEDRESLFELGLQVVPTPDHHTFRLKEIG